MKKNPITKASLKFHKNKARTSLKRKDKQKKLSSENALTQWWDVLIHTVDRLFRRLSLEFFFFFLQLLGKKIKFICYLEFVFNGRYPKL